MLGDLQLDIGEIEDAQISFAKVAELDPDNIEIWLDYSHSFAVDFDFFGTMECINNGIEHQPHNADLLYRKFNYLVKFKKFKEAYAVLEEALMMDFDAHIEIFIYDEKLKDDDNLLRIIEMFKPQA
jgi:tetratricopeptide (TPR) repeat protein